jgi:ATP-dependent RNA helicase DHX57
MGKKDKKSKGAAPKDAPKCTCDHSFTCLCGNRPERPSRGHKWDPESQEWGGKGHKQKGGSGQTAFVSKVAQTTAIGKTQLEQWQKMPSELLRDFCQKQKRPPPKFKEVLIDHGKTKFKVRVIVPDSKDRDKDLIVVPSRPVGNEEQAKEEASLLALLQLTPSLPHERKLPEPYKTTWLAAIQSLKEKSNNSKSTREFNGNNPNNNNNNSKPKASNASNRNTANGASSNTNLSLGNAFTSQAERRKLTAEKKRLRNSRIRKHEAVRMANRDHPVFLSATLRTQIQMLLKGDTDLFMEDPAGDDTELEPFESDRQTYVEERLHQEGFTKRQARTAFVDQLRTSKHQNDTDAEELWDDLYDDCLQWLCIHLDEDQLPEGIDPRGATLEVVSNVGPKSKSKPGISPQAQQFASDYGLLDQDSAFLMAQNKLNSLEDALWTKLCELANVSLSATATPSDENNQMFDEEMEAMEAIFPSDCNVTIVDGRTTVVIKTPDDLTLTIAFASRQYPSAFPQRVLVTGNWPKRIGLSFHVQLVKFLSTLTLGEPMLFEIYGQMQLLLQTVEELEDLSLSPNAKSLPAKSSTEGDQSSGKKQPEKSSKQKAPLHKAFKRPRARGGFWSTPPSKTPAATPFPNIIKSLKDCRSRLPAGKARSLFLARMKEADNVSSFYHLFFDSFVD